MVQPRNVVVVMWWAFHATLQVFLLHFVSALFYLGTVVEDVKGFGLKEVGHVARWYGRAIALSLMSVPCAFISALAMLVPSMRKRSLDALAWTSDEVLRSKIGDYVYSRMRLDTSDAQVLIGHSQGGSILTSVCERSGSAKAVTLMTLGSGQGLLSMLNAVPKGMKRWATLTQILVIFHTLAGLLVVLPLVSDALRAAGVGLDALTSMGATTWLLWAAPIEASHALMSPLQQTLGLLAQLIERPFPWFWFWITFSVAMTVVFMVFLRRERLLTLGEKVQKSCRPSVHGLDLSADHDYVSSLLSVLGSGSRFRKIPQTGSFPMDHLAYFQNGPFVMAELVDAIERRATEEKDWLFSCSNDDAIRVHRSSLRIRRAKLWTVLILCLAVFASGSFWLEPLLFIPIGIAAGAACLVIWRSTSRASLGKHWGMRADSETNLSKAGRRRESLASKAAAAFYGLAALPLAGAAALEYGAYFERLGDLTTEAYWGVSGLATLGAIFLVTAVFTRAAGIQSSLYMAIAGLLIGAITWSAQGNAYSWTIAAMYAFGAFRSCLLLWRIS